MVPVKALPSRNQALGVLRIGLGGLLERQDGVFQIAFVVENDADILPAGAGRRGIKRSSLIAGRAGIGNLLLGHCRIVLCRSRLRQCRAQD